MTTSPDRTAWIQYHHGLDGEAMWCTGAKDNQGNVWTANYSPKTPIHPAQGFSAELASPNPVIARADAFR
ncbi:DUF317 domain-containing protein [Streptomyces sp. NPDC056479]|uniref:DUF317 domain-containing protein n=1 Tax=Streptomyces sp. NPDC056479 TaxID=3345832 RepID=UPI0036BB5880